MFSKDLLQLHKKAGVGHIRLKRVLEEIRTRLGQGLGGNHIHPEQGQELEQGHMMGQEQGRKMELGQESTMEQAQVLVQNKTGQEQM